MKRYLAIIFFFIAGISTAAAASSKPLAYGVWLPFWKAEDGAEDVSVNLDKLSEVSPFSYEIGAGGKIIDDANINDGSWDAWFSAAREAWRKDHPDGRVV